MSQRYCFRPHSSRMLRLNAFGALLALGLFACSVSLAEEKPSVQPVVYASHAGIPSCHMTLGPTGAKAWMRGYEFVVMTIDQGSPAHGELMLADVIFAANGTPFGPENDSRITLGNAIGKAEADGTPLRLSVKRRGMPVEVDLTLPQLGAFSATWPMDCPKSEAILQNACQSLLLSQLPDGEIVTDGNMGTFLGGLLLLGAGEARYLDGARRAAYSVAGQNHRPLSLNNWNAAYGGLLLAEYYLATGDDSVLKGLQSRCDQLAEGQMNCGAWGHSAPYGGYGALNQAGIIGMMTLVLADECGVAVDADAKRKALEFFGQFAEIGAVPYGDFTADRRQLDMNGRNATTAIAMHLAGYDVKAKALAEPVALSYWMREEGHTGGFFSMTWGPLAVHLLRPEKFRAFMDYQKWHYNLTRNWKGELVHIPYYEALTRFDDNAYVEFGGDFTTGGYGLLYAMPRKHLRITGAPQSIFAASSRPGGKLGLARQQYLAREWSACDKTLAELAIVDEPLPPAHRAWLSQLEAARALMKASTDRVFLEMESNLLERAPYRVSEQLAALKRAAGPEIEDDPRCKRMEEQLAKQAYQIKEGGNFYDVWAKTETRAFMTWTPQGKMALELLDGLPTLQKPLWEALSPISMIQPQTWASRPLAAGAPLPADWYQADFDDEDWIQGESITTRFTMPEADAETAKGLTGAIAARRVFTVDDSTGHALKLRLQTVRESITTVYLNGQLIAHIARGNRGGYASIPLDSSVFKLLKKGENVLAVSSTRQGQGGNHLDVGLYVNREPINTRMLPPLRATELTLGDVTADATLRVRETKEKMQKAFRERFAAMETAELLRELDSLSGSVRYLVEQALAEKGSAVLPHVLPLAESDVWSKRSAYCDVLGTLAAKANSDKDAPAPEEKEAILTALAGEVKTLTSLLDDAHFWVRNRAAATLRNCGDAATSALPKLNQKLSDPHQWVRLTALQAISRIETDPEKLVAAAVTALKMPGTNYSLGRNSLRILKKYPDIAEGKLEGVASFLEGPPHGFGGKMTLEPMMKLGVSLDPEGDVMVPLLIEGILGDPGLGQQRGNFRKPAAEQLASYGEKARPAILRFKAFLENPANDDVNYRKDVMEALRILGADVGENEVSETGE